MPAHNAKYKQVCNTKQDVIAAFGQNLTRQVKGSERASFWGNPLAGGLTKTIEAVGIGASRNETKRLSLHSKIADKAVAMFAKLKQVNQDYVIYSVGSKCVRYMKNSNTRATIRDGAEYAAAKAQHADWARSWPSKALHYDNSRNAVKWTKVSNHSFGTAIDINPSTNPYKSGKDFDIPKWMVEIFREFGFSWGGYYHDYMHFEYEQKNVSPTAATTTPTPQTNPSPGVNPPASGAPSQVSPTPAPAPSAASFCTKCGKPLSGDGSHPPSPGGTPPSSGGTPPGGGSPSSGSPSPTPNAPSGPLPDLKEVDTSNQKIRRVWFWGDGGFIRPSNHERYTAKAKDLGLTDICLCINDLRRDEYYTGQKPEVIADLCKRLRANNIMPHVMTWLRPTKKYIEGAARGLIPLAGMAQLESIQFDLEEPWVHGSDHAKAAREYFQPSFMRSKPCRLGVNAICCHSKAKLEPMIQYMDYVVPQAYSIKTDKNTNLYNPGITQSLGLRKWKGYGKPMIFGLAAWKQEGAGGLGTYAAMDKCIKTVEGFTPEVREVCYWSWKWVLKSEKVYSFIKTISHKARSLGASG